ncbi:hypothetical protein HMPREF1577_00981, partial [Gardnerella pickettii JCP8017A]
MKTNNVKIYVKEKIMNQESTNVEATNTEQTSAQSEINQAATLLKDVNVKKHALDITS